MAAKPIKSLELHYTKIQFLIIKIILQMYVCMYVCIEEVNLLKKSRRLDSKVQSII